MGTRKKGDSGKKRGGLQHGAFNVNGGSRRVWKNGDDINATAKASVYVVAQLVSLSLSQSLNNLEAWLLRVMKMDKKIEEVNGGWGPISLIDECLRNSHVGCGSVDGNITLYPPSLAFTIF